MELLNSLLASLVVFSVASVCAASEHMVVKSSESAYSTSDARRRAGTGTDAVNDVVVVTNEGQAYSYMYRLSLPIDGGVVYTDLGGFKQIRSATVHTVDPKNTDSAKPICFFWLRNKLKRWPMYYKISPSISDTFTIQKPLGRSMGAHRLYCYNADRDISGVGRSCGGSGSVDRVNPPGMNKYFVIVIETWMRQLWLVRVCRTSASLSTFVMRDASAEEVRNNIRMAELITFPGDMRLKLGEGTREGKVGLHDGERHGSGDAVVPAEAAAAEQEEVEEEVLAVRVLEGQGKCQIFYRQLKQSRSHGLSVGYPVCFPRATSAYTLRCTHVPYPSDSEEERERWK